MSVRNSGPARRRCRCRGSSRAVLVSQPMISARPPLPTTTARRAARSRSATSAVLAVVAHPDDESFGLGAVLAAFAAGGARVAVLCFTHGEASTLHGVAGDLHRLRAHELAAAAHVLGVATTVLRSYPAQFSRAWPRPQGSGVSQA